jgi:N-acetylated-alpha-linked acidic dipeptidase
MATHICGSDDPTVVGGRTGLSPSSIVFHAIYAPGALTGFDLKTLPAVREAIEANALAQADAFAVVTAGALNACSERLERVAALLRP